MRTSKPISTISYNTKEFLISKLNEMYNNGRISDWMFIKHYAEDDESKNHYHVYMEPNRMLDTMEIQKFFREIDLKNPSAPPLGMINFNSSKTDDWILYCLHFEPYLKTKGEERVYSYTKEDIVYKDELTFEYNYNHAFKGSDWAKSNQILQAIREGITDPLDLILSGIIPFNQTTQAKCLDGMVRERRTYRGNHKGHEEI